MSRDGWTLRSSLWFVFLVALGLKAATGTWNNLKRGSVEYHRRLSDGCESWSVRELRLAKLVEDDSSSRSISDPAFAAELRQRAISMAFSARSNSLLAASLAEKAELCEQSRLGWIFLQYETLRNAPDLPVSHVSGQEHRPWFMNATLVGFFKHPVVNAIMKTLELVDYFGLACLALAIIGKNRFARAKVILGVRKLGSHIRLWLMRRIW
jgi:hypothetical protein